MGAFDDCYLFQRKLGETEELIKTTPYIYVVYLAVGQTCWGCENSKVFKENELEEAMEFYSQMEAAMRFPEIRHVDSNRGRRLIKKQYRNRSTCEEFDALYPEGKVIGQEETYVVFEEESEQ